MAQAAQALTIAPRYTKPPNFAGSETAWRSLCECYPSAETPDVVMAVVEYCAVRKLDPYKRPVHVVPMYNARLRRKVQVVMQGINEVEITAARTGQWAGMDAPVYGPTIDRTFTGEFENDDGSKRNVEVKLRFPDWCMVTVFRLVGGERRAFTEQLWWEECYGRAGFRSAVPNQRWQLAPRQMLHKCTKAAVLRAAFPEEGFGPTSDEMEGREIDAGGITIDGKIDQGAAAEIPARRSGITSEASHDRQAQVYESMPDPLEEQNGTRWLANLLALLGEATTLNEVITLAGHVRVRQALDTAPTLIRAQINDALKAAHERFAPQQENEATDAERAAQANAGPDWNAGGDRDPLADLLAEVEAMDAITLAGLTSNAVWRAKVRDLFPLDQDRLDEAIAARKQAVGGAKR